MSDKPRFKTEERRIYPQTTPNRKFISLKSEVLGVRSNPDLAALIEIEVALNRAHAGVVSLMDFARTGAPLRRGDFYGINNEVYMARQYLAKLTESKS